MKKKKKEPYVTIEDLWKRGDNKYGVIARIAEKINQQIELSDERDDTLLLKELEDLSSGSKNEKNSSGSDR